MDPLLLTMRRNQEIARIERARKKALFNEYRKDKPMFPPTRAAFDEVINYLETNLEKEVVPKPLASIALSLEHYNTSCPAWNELVDWQRVFCADLTIGQPWYVETYQFVRVCLDDTMISLREEWRLRHPSIGCKWDGKTFTVGDI